MEQHVLCARLTAMIHALGSPYVRDQLSLRVMPLNEKRLQPDGDYVLYWMQSTQRLEDNWALRFATLEADRIGKPLLIHHGLDPHYTYASARFHTFVMQGAQELAARAGEFGFTYRFALRRKVSDDRRVLDRLAKRAAVVVTDLFPTAGVAERSARLAERINCRMVAVDSFGCVPTASFHSEEFAARTIRPKLLKVLDFALEAVEDRAPKRAMPASLVDALDVDWLEVANTDIAAEVARCGVDHSVGPVALRGGYGAARERLDSFVSDALPDYAERRRNPSDTDGTSRLSPYLHCGMISAREIATTAREATSVERAEAFVNEMVVWRELGMNFCIRNRDYGSLEALPDWVHRTMAAHAEDARDANYTLADLELAHTHDDIWNAGQRELLETGVMHNVMRMLWGKSVITWAPTYEQALGWLLQLNNKYALDGRDPNSYAGIQWCFGKFDRPFAERPVWGTIRPMSLTRARTKYDMSGYLARWGEAPQLV